MQLPTNTKMFAIRKKKFLRGINFVKLTKIFSSPPNSPRSAWESKCLQYTKKFLRGINFVKLTKNNFQSTQLPEERMGVIQKKIGGCNEFPKKFTKKKFTGGELICKNFGVNGMQLPTNSRSRSKNCSESVFFSFPMATARWCGP